MNPTNINDEPAADFCAAAANAWANGRVHDAERFFEVAIRILDLDAEPAHRHGDQQ